METLAVIKSYLEYYRALEKKTHAKENFLLSVSCFVIFFLFFSFFESTFFFDTTFERIARLLLVILMVSLGLKSFFNFMAWHTMTHEKLALGLEKKFPELENHLINSWQLSVKRNFGSEVLVKKLRDDTAVLLKNVDPSDRLDREKFLLYRRFALTGCALFCLYAMVSPGNISKSFSSLFLPFSDSYVYMKVEPGNCSVERGSDVQIKAVMKNQDSVPSLEIKDGTGRKLDFSGSGNRTFSVVIRNVNDSFSYRVAGAGRRTGWFSVKVLEKTFVSKMKLIYDFPAYAGMKSKNEEKPLSGISCLAGTRLTIEPVFNNDVGDVFLVLGDGNVFADRGTGKTRRFLLNVSGSTLYEFRYYDFLTGNYVLTQKQRLDATLDQAPFVQFIEPAKDITASGRQAVPLKIRVTDDFGAMNVKFRSHAGEGDISPDDPVFFQAALKGSRGSEVSATLKIPANLSERLAYYAECTDNFPVNPNIGRSSVFFVYPEGTALKQGQEKKAEDTRKSDEDSTKMESLKKQLDKFIESQKSIIETAKRLDKAKNLADRQDLKSLAGSEKKWAETFEKMVDDLGRIGKQTKGKFTLADELVEMVSHVQSAEAGMKKPPVTIAVTEAETGLELAKEITTNIEKWLSEYPDNIKWEMAEPSKNYDVPEAKLPGELEDMIGDLIEKEEDMKNEIEDVTSSWMDSLDKGAGWGVSDGPISNMSAKGITGNLMPNQQEIGGRSGEGRTGRSYGEMVGKTAVGKGGRKTPARVTPDNLEPGEIQDVSGENSLGPTGGGKASGLGPEGLRGQVQDLSFSYNILAGEQKKLVERAESLARSMQVLNVYNPQLEKAISAMKEFHVQLTGGRYVNLLAANNVILSNLKEARNTITKNSVIKIENDENISKKKGDSAGIWEEKIPEGYETVVREYYKKISNR